MICCRWFSYLSNLIVEPLICKVHFENLAPLRVINQFSLVQLLSRVRLYDPMDCSTPGFPVHHQLLELTQTHVHWVGDAIQPSHPLWSPSPPAFTLSQHQFSSVAHLCSTLCDPMNHSTPGLPVLSPSPGVHSHSHALSWWCHPTSHPLSSPFPPAPNPSQHQSLFQWVNSSHKVAKVSEFLPQHQSFQWTPRTDLL